MKRFVIYLLLLMAIPVALNAQATIYDFEIDSIAGSKKIRFADFTGKKILIVNTASLDSNATQYADLKSLNQFFKDSLVIIAIPSNSFGTEPGSNIEITSFYTQAAHNCFPVSKKLEVDGPNMHPLYVWLTHQPESGFGTTRVKKGFKKYLIDSKGKLTAIISHHVRPNSIEIMELIKNTK
jgi:glutathione peroxidase